MERLAYDDICTRRYLYQCTNTFACFQNKYDVDKICNIILDYKV